jgi:hypothetical protein
MSREDAGPSAQEEAKREFLSRAIPFMLAKFYKAEAYGINWRAIRLEELDGHIILAEEFAKPTEEYQE